MTGPQPLLAVDDLVVDLRTELGVVHAVDGLSLHVGTGEIVGVVGESGSGKSITALSVLGLLPPAAVVRRGTITLRGEDLRAATGERMRAVRGGEIAIIFQDPMTALNPVMTVGRQIAEALRLHDRGLSRRAARERATELLALVGVPAAGRRFGQYPHEFSGGMRQRVLIAIAIANRPRLLIADEPTTALDVTIQAQILDLLRTAQRETRAATLLITHDLGVIAELADRVVVVYAGRVVEDADVHALFTRPRHPYTAGLLAGVPRVDTETPLRVIPGAPPDMTRPPAGCPFHPRCPLVRDRCRTDRPPAYELAGGRYSACHFHHELADADPGTLFTEVPT